MRRLIGTILLVIAFVAGGTVAASAAPLPTCKSVDLDIAVGRTGSAAGTFYREIKFTMRSLGACVLKGFPGVSYVDRAGAQVGNAAYRVGEPGELITSLTGPRFRLTWGLPTGRTTTLRTVSRSRCGGSRCTRRTSSCRCTSGSSTRSGAAGR